MLPPASCISPGRGAHLFPAGLVGPAAVGQAAPLVSAAQGELPAGRMQQHPGWAAKQLNNHSLFSGAQKATTRSPGPCQGPAMAQAGLAGPFPSPAQAPGPVAACLPGCRAGRSQSRWEAANSSPTAMAPCPDLWHCPTSACQSCQAARPGPCLHPAPAARGSDPASAQGPSILRRGAVVGRDVGSPGEKNWQLPLIL